MSGEFGILTGESLVWPEKLTGGICLLLNVSFEIENHEFNSNTTILLHKSATLLLRFET